MLWLWTGRGWRGFIAPYFGENIDVNNPSVLLCPADTPDPQYGATSYEYSMAFYHNPQQINSMTTKEDTYLNPPQPSVKQESDRVTNPAGKIIVGEWSSNHRRTGQGPDNGWWGWEGTRNFLFANGKVAFLDAKKIRPANDGNPNPNLTIDGIEGIDYPR